MKKNKILISVLIIAICFFTKINNIQAKELYLTCNYNDSIIIEIYNDGSYIFTKKDSFQFINLPTTLSIKSCPIMYESTTGGSSNNNHHSFSPPGTPVNPKSTATEAQKKHFSQEINQDVDLCGKYILGYSNNPAYPAYWLQIILNVMRYAAIILLIVLSSIEFIKAIVSQNGDALKKAISTFGKRLCICVIIFFVPTIINFILENLGISGVCKSVQ